MTKRDKQFKKLLNPNSTLKFSELEAILYQNGYVKIKPGKSVGSARRYYNPSLQHRIRLHEPHPQKEVKKYQIQLIIREFKRLNIL